MINVYISDITDPPFIDLDIKDLVDSSLVNVYLEESIADVSFLPIYRDDTVALDNNPEDTLLYFDWAGSLKAAVRSFTLYTNLTLNLSKAVSYLRRLF